MNERELLELAAKACGIKKHPILTGRFSRPGKMDFVSDMGRTIQTPFVWEPDVDDGDCARMEAALGIDVSWTSAYVMADHDSLLDCMIEPFNPHNGDKQAARRMASLRVAAEIGRAKGGA